MKLSKPFSYTGDRMSKIRVAISGAAGRMGQRLIALGFADPTLQIIAAIDSPKNPKLGGDAGVVAGIGPIGVLLESTLKSKPDVVIDFSVSAGAEAITAVCVAQGIPLVMATTGLEEVTKQQLKEASKSIAVLWSPSMSLSVNLAMKLTEVSAKALKDHPGGADVEIIERHHRFKEDSPSGTALKFGELVAAAMGQSVHRHGREGRPGPRPHNEIGYHAVRVGDNPGEHTIIFGLLGETLEIAVKATNRDCYAHGALAAAKFLAGKPPRLYGMSDLLNF
jgi:4-hydroxy-tetrahydrodipicolinate reductase